MKVKALDVFPVRERRSGRSYVLLKVSTDQGLVGWGESSAITPAALAKARALAVGQEPFRYDYLTRQLAGEAVGAALNMALLDLAGQEAKVPVFQLLGGPTRNKVRAMCPLLAVEQREALQALGHRAFSVPIHLPKGIMSRPALLSFIAKQFADLRKAAGDKVDFAADGQSLLPSAEAADIAVALEAYRPLFLDRPTRESNNEVLSRISAESTTPLGLGHSFTDVSPIQNLLRDGIVDVVRMDMHKLGITPLRRAAALAETYYVAIAPFHTGGPVATAAAKHLAASLPNFFIQELPAVLDREERQLRDALVGGGVETVSDGYLSLSTKPGLGIQVDEALVKRMAA